MNNIQSEIRPIDLSQNPQVYRIIATNTQPSLQVSQADISIWIGWILMLVLVGLPIILIYQSICQANGKRSHSRSRKNGNSSYSSGGSDCHSDSSWDDGSSSSVMLYCSSSDSDSYSSSGDSDSYSSSGDSDSYSSSGDSDSYSSSGDSDSYSSSGDS
ncbi:MAG: hypothetical protein RID09_27310, partial [Coleofasciculus sp. G1-WW12-02]|uniref:hypothetical protein n=1 Tax=Coleofasciculus sp. G1-WW12-02 TaxID=3068483 RepID=UPI0032FE5261